MSSFVFCINYFYLFHYFQLFLADFFFIDYENLLSPNWILRVIHGHKTIVYVLER